MYLLYLDGSGSVKNPCGASTGKGACCTALCIAEILATTATVLAA